MKNLKVKLPTVMVVFGARGDLSRKKLYPAFFDLYQRGILPGKFTLLGVSRSDISEKDYKKLIKESILKNSKQKIDKKKLDSFLKFAKYQSGLFEDLKTYKNVADISFLQDKKWKVCSNKLFYLAVPPKNYKTILVNLQKSGLTIPCSDKKGWTRVLIEKPFGSDYKTAKELDKLLGELFLEKQIFRIDHYLAKETIQNILTFRFVNSIFQPIWSGKYIEKIEIKLLEKIDIANRGEFYDGIGALRDVGQNHILQILAAVAMENPIQMNAKSIRENRAKLLSFLKIPTKKEIENFKKGQYEGYKNQKGVHKKSKTETYFKITAFLKNERWKNVPFVLESGKAMPESKTEVKVYFKEKKPCFCIGEHQSHSHQNVLTFKIQPDEGILLDFFVKKPGLEMDYLKKQMSFKYERDILEKTLPDAYEKILFDCMVGDQTLFASTREILASWRFITKILDAWSDKEPQVYKKGELPK